jgi:hypothetical protein
MSYVHYRENGEIAPIRVDGTGVGQYDANSGSIEAEDYFAASQIKKTENQQGGFQVLDIDHGDFLTFPNIHGLKGKGEIVLRAAALEKVRIEIRRDNQEGELLASYRLKRNKDGSGSDTHIFDFPPQEGQTSLCFVFRGRKEQLLGFDSFSFQ